MNLFHRLDLTHNVFDIPDAELTRKVKRITNKGIILSSLIGLACVCPVVWLDVQLANESFLVHYGWVALATIVATAIEFYVLFIISLKAVYEVSDLINLHATESELMKDGLFSVKHILARTALELPDPELEILGIDPFKRISKKNLFMLGLLYKAKIMVSNAVLKYVLLFSLGPQVFGISILYGALLVECFWNSVVIKRVICEARLRLFGLALANQIAKNVIEDKILEHLSPAAQKGCLRAIGNAVVMAQNYHPNMIILLIRFQQILKITEESRYDDWNLFLVTLKNVSEEERNFLLDLFTVSAAFDGKLSQLEKENLKIAYGNEYDLYYPRLFQLTQCLKDGQLNAALKLCELDLIVG